MIPLSQKRTAVAQSEAPKRGFILFGQIILACLLLPSLLAACSSPQFSTGNSSAGTVSGSSSGTTNPVPTATSNAVSAAVPLQIDLIYSSVEITILDVKQARSFPDDQGNTTSDILRLNLKENNPTSSTPYYDYSSAARLLLPDQTSVAPLSTQQHSDPAPNTERTNWIDFPVPMSVKADLITLQLGKGTEAQELIPLKSGADVSKYQAKTANPNAQMTYGKITWTVVQATSELSYQGKQADQGMMFVVVDLNANNTSPDAGGGDLVQVRLTSGGTTNPAQEFLQPVAGNQTNVKSTLSFIMPQASTHFTLTFLPSNAYGIKTASSVDFQVG